MEVRSVARIDRKSSIESEPRTLSFLQIQLAREAALSVINSRSMEDAMNIFTEGLEPVISAANGMYTDGSYAYDEIEDDLVSNEYRDVASAPF